MAEGRPQHMVRAMALALILPLVGVWLGLSFESAWSPEPLGSFIAIRNLALASLLLAAVFTGRRGGGWVAVGCGGVWLLQEGMRVADGMRRWPEGGPSHVGLSPVLDGNVDPVEAGTMAIIVALVAMRRPVATTFVVVLALGGVVVGIHRRLLRPLWSGADLSWSSRESLLALGAEGVVVLALVGALLLVWRDRATPMAPME